MTNEFLTHPFIQSIASKEKWTISNKDKRPTDMWSLIYSGKLHGAVYPDSTCLCNLHTLERYFPNRTNQTFYLEAMEDRWVCLDIEPKCPDEIKQKFLNTPYIYGEVSLSGNGYHLIYPLPASFSDYPDAWYKLSLQDGNGYWEILLNHYCTFTGNMIPLAQNPTESFDAIFQDICSKQRKTEKADVGITADVPAVSQVVTDYVLSTLLPEAQKYDKTPADFPNDKNGQNEDHSRYEFNFFYFMEPKARKLAESHICTLQIHQPETDIPTIEELEAWFLYQLGLQCLPYRPKHDQKRNHMPWLLFVAWQAISVKEANRQKVREAKAQGIEDPWASPTVQED